MVNIYENFIFLLIEGVAIIFVLSLHEFAHAFVAYKCGDPTAKWSGRMTLNPVKHIDPIGLVSLFLFRFGWAKPVPVNPMNFKNRSLGVFLTSIAGILVNYLTAFLVLPLIYLSSKYISNESYGVYLLEMIFLFSISFCVFNLLPFYPLDGFRVIEGLNKKRGKFFYFWRKYSYFILLGLILWGIVVERISNISGNFGLEYLDILGFVLMKLRNWFMIPIEAFWNLIF